MKLKIYLPTIFISLLLTGEVETQEIERKTNSQHSSHINNMAFRDINQHHFLAQKSTEAENLIKQGTEQFQAGQQEVAIQSWQQALKIYRQQDDLIGEGITLGRIGLAYEAQENYLQAINYYQEALSIAQKIDNHQLKASLLGNLGNSYSQLDRYAEALEVYEKSLTIWKQLNNRAATGKVLRGLGNVNLALGRYDLAEDFQQQSLTIAEEFDDYEGIVNSLNSIGIIFANQGEYQQASEYYQKSLDKLSQVDNPFINQKLNVQILNNLGSVNHAQQNLDRALDYYQQGLNIAENKNFSAQKGLLLSGIGSVYLSLDDYPQAQANLQQGLNIAQQTGDRLLKAESLHNIGYAQWKLKQLSEAETSFRQAIEVRGKMRQRLSDRDRVSLFDTQLQSYPLLRRVLVEQNKPEAALEVAEAERARAFVQLLAARSSAETTSNEVLQQQITAPSIQQIKEIAKQQNATLVEYSFVADENFIAQGKLYGEYKQIYIWVVKPTGEIVFKAFDLTPQQVESIVQIGEWANKYQFKNIFYDYFNSIESGTNSSLAKCNEIDITKIEFDKFHNEIYLPKKKELQSQFKSIHQSLYQVLIAPITDHLPDSSEFPIIFIPQKELFNVSFPALQASNEDYLIERNSILTAPAIQVLQLIAKNDDSDSSKDNSLVIGNPTNPKSVRGADGCNTNLLIKDLPSAEQEATDIAHLLNTQAIIREAATETLVKQKIGSAKIVHLAAHGSLEDFFDSGVPGAIALSPSDNDDGLLTSDEILTLQLHADLVVISACDAGRGLLTRDGIIGLSRSLFLSGASNLVLPLWEVEDDVTAHLMKKFYSQPLQFENKAQALRQAMLTIKKKESYNHPIYWAAFNLIGGAN